jgi:hypothetical protein
MTATSDQQFDVRRKRLKKLLAFIAAGEAALGLVLLLYPPVVVRLLFNAELVGMGIVMGRVCGIALIALGVACWPGSGAVQALWGILTYSVLVTVYLAYLGIEGEWVGNLLWPTVALHAFLTFLLARAWYKGPFSNYKP